MAISLVLFLILFNILKLDLHDYFADTVVSLHQLCLGMVPDSEYTEIYEAIGCGKRISNVDLHKILVTTGLVHVFVVSGTHLSFIGNFLKKLRIPTFLEIIILGIYSMATSFNPPVVRAFLSFVIRKVDNRLSLMWTRDMLVWHVSFLCLILFHGWFDSFSFMLSWSAALGISLSGKHKNILVKNTCIYLVMLPVLANISTPHPMVILINAVILPIFGMIFFPLTLLSIIFNFIAPITDIAWSYLLSFLSILSNNIPLFKSDPNFSYITIFFYLITLHLAILAYRLWQRRNIKV